MTVRLRAVTAVSLTVLGISAVLSAASADPAPRVVDRSSDEGTDRDSDQARESAARAAPPPLLPNARALTASMLYIAHNGAGHRVLRYQSGLANIGRGPLELRSNTLRPCPHHQRHASQVIFRDRDRNGRFSRKHDTRITRHSAGCMIFHPTHSHWHFQAAVSFTLYRATARQPVIVVGRKTSFCLRDSQHAPDRWPTPSYGDYYGECSRQSPQGISIGWADIYQNFLPGQSLRLPDTLRNGVYCLRARVDPLNKLRETDDSDNSSVRAFRLDGSQVAARPNSRCR